MLLSALDKANEDLMADSNGGGFGVFKLGNFSKMYAARILAGEEISEEQIKDFFADVGRQMAVMWRIEKEKK